MRASLQGYPHPQSRQTMNVGKDDLHRVPLLPLAVLAVMSLGGCATTPRATGHLIEGPVRLGRLRRSMVPECGQIEWWKTAAALPMFDASWKVD